MELNYSLQPLEWALLACMAVTAAMLIRFYLMVYAKVYRYKPPRPTQEKHPVSVVLSSKNEYEALKKNLLFWLEQKYPDFEVVVVYEESDEDVSQLLKEFERRYDKLVIINTNQSINFFDEQKFSLSIGTKSAHNGYVIMAHPEFRPDSEYCIDHIQAAFTPETCVVVGQAIFTERKKRFCSYSLFRMLEQSLQYLGFAIGGKAFTGRQCLLAYRKDFFLEHRGFSDSYALNCGGFDRFANRITSPRMVSVQTSPESRVKYTRTLTLREMLRQERWFRNTLAASNTTPRRETRAYRFFNNLYILFLVLGIVYFVMKCLPVQPEAVPLWALVFLFLGLCKFTVQAVVMQKAAKSSGYGTLWFMLPLYAILSLFLQVALWGRKRRR